MTRNAQNNRHCIEKSGINRRQFFTRTTGTVGAIAVAYSLPSISCKSSQPKQAAQAAGDPIVETSNGKCAAIQPMACARSGASVTAQRL